MPTFHTLSIREMADGLANGDFTSTELVTNFLDRIEQLDKNLNSFITVTREHALEQAKAADALRAQGKAQYLTGVPIAQKDIFCTKDIKTSCASRFLDNFMAPYDATVVEKCNAAGLIMLGKTNMDEFAMGSSNENSFYGPVKNPWNEDYVPGGSSGGSAAAVAARLCPAATGTDTGGSIRQPAALCGITGLKPSYGRVSRYGMVAFASSLDQGGIFAYNAEDTALLLNIIAGFDNKDSTSVNQAVPDYTENLNRPIKGLKIGLPKEYFAKGIDSEVEQTIMASIELLKSLGAEFKEVSLSNVNLSIPAYYVIAPAEASSNLSRYDGVRFGRRCEEPKDLEDLYKRSRQEGFGDEVQRRIMIGTYALSAGYYDAYYLKAQKVRRLIKEDFDKAFAEVDVLLSPVTPTAAFKIGEKANDPVSMYLSDIYTIATNLAGLPGMSIPAGFTKNQLPIGLQLTGKYFDETTLLNVAHQYQQASDWHKQMPEKYI